jgi:hypothetical protein
MKQILKYLIFLMIGIIIYILYNGINGFSVGGWYVYYRYDTITGEYTKEGDIDPDPYNPETIPPGPEPRENEHLLTLYGTEDFESNQENIQRGIDNFINSQGVINEDTAMNIWIDESDDEEEIIQEPPRQPSPTAEEGVPDSITITISIISRNIRLQVPLTINLQQLRGMINRQMEIDPPDYKGYRLIFSDTGRTVFNGIILDDDFIDTLSDTLSVSIRNLRIYFQNYRFDTFGVYYPYTNRPNVDRGYVKNQMNRIINTTIPKINTCLRVIGGYVQKISEYLGEYSDLYIQTLDRNQSGFIPTPDDLSTLDLDDLFSNVLDSDVLEYVDGTESEKERFDRILSRVNEIIERYKSEILDIQTNMNYSISVTQQEQENINNKFQIIFKLINLLFLMLNDGMFLLEPTLVDVLVYHNELSLILRLPPDDKHHSVCASEGEPPSTD